MGDVRIMGAPGPTPAAPGRTPEDRQRAGSEFEALVAGQLASAMLESVEVDEKADPGAGSAAMWRGFLADAVGREMAGRNSLGLAQRVAEELARADGVEP